MDSEKSRVKIRIKPLIELGMIKGEFYQNNFIKFNIKSHQNYLNFFISPDNLDKQIQPKKSINAYIAKILSPTY